VNLITAETAFKKLQDDRTAVLVDVRTPSEFRSQHIHGSINLPLESFKADKLPFKRETAIHVICQSGGRSAKFCDKLQDNGYLSVYDVDGGVDAWKASGMELVNGEKSMSMERQVRIAAGTMVIIGVAFGAAVAPAWYALSGFIGAGLVFAGVTDTCGMGMALAKMPWNQK
jgi:rhodanese-related sulfurtransferase